MAAQEPIKKRFRPLGVLPLAFFVAQGIHYWQINEPGHMLWMCNIGNLLLAVGLFFGQVLLTRVAIIWLVPGVAIWFIYVVPTWGLLLSGKLGYGALFAVLSSTLAHLGGLSVGLVILRRIGMDRGSWLYAFVWYLLVQLLSRLVTAPALNVNVSQGIQRGWEQTFNSYLRFWLVLTALVAVCLWLLGQILRRLWPEAHVKHEAPT